MEMERELYNQLQAKQNNGEQLNFEDITYEELYTLWWKEVVLDLLIDRLYDVPKETVRKKRYKLNITRDEMLAKQGMELIFSLNNR